jgi:hypothetical protein
MFINYYEVRNIIQMIFIIIFFNEHFLINNRFKNNIIAIFTMIFWNRCHGISMESGYSIGSSGKL